MDPTFYNEFKTSWLPAELPPHIPVNEQQRDRMDNGSKQQNPVPDTNWTVSSPNIMRGSLETGKEAEPNTNDPRMQVGWNSADPTKKPTDLSDMRWMSVHDQQPMLWTMRDDQGTPRASDQASHYPYPDLSLPHPSLHLDFRMAVTLNPRISVGPTPFGHRNWISFTSGKWSGSWGSGSVLPGGQDSQLIVGDGSAHLSTNYILQTYDDPPAHIVVKTHGWRTGPADVLAKLADPQQADGVDPNSYKFRLFIDMETGDERYRDKVNYGMWVGSGMRKGAEVIYDAYRVS